MFKIQNIKLKSKRQFELIDITQQVKRILESAGIKNGLVNIFSPHTTAAVRINHNESLLIQDVMSMLYRLVPLDISYAHDLFETRSGLDADERSNAHAHIKTFLLGNSETVPVADGQMCLGEKQSIFFVELDGERERSVTVAVSGE